MIIGFLDSSNSEFEMKSPRDVSIWFKLPTSTGLFLNLKVDTSQYGCTMNGGGGLPYALLRSTDSNSSLQSNLGCSLELESAVLVVAILSVGAPDGSV